MRAEEVEHVKSLSEIELRREIADGRFGVPDSKLRLEVEPWLAEKVASNAAASSARKEAREDESLSISRKALDISERASRRALIAIALSTTMAIYEIIKWLSK